MSYVLVLLLAVVILAASYGASVGAVAAVHAVFPTEETTVTVYEKCFEVSFRRDECILLEEPEVRTEDRALGGGDLYVGIAAFLLTAGGMVALVVVWIESPGKVEEEG